MLLPLLAGMPLLFLVGCSSQPEAISDAGAPDACVGSCAKAIASARVVGKTSSLPYFGDLWANTWGDDDRLYLSWGDGTGLANCVPTFDGKTPGAWAAWDPPNQRSPGCFNVSASCPKCGVRVEFCRTFDCKKCYPLCPFTDAGLLALRGTAPGFETCTLESCLVARNLPTPAKAPMAPDGTRTGKDDKVSSMLFVDRALILAGHSPSGSPTLGYLARSLNRGKTWEVIKGSPWGQTSHFRVLMLINMGQGYALNSDGYVYALGMDAEWSPLKSQPIYLARVPRLSVTDYTKYEYLTGVSPAGAASWSNQQGQASPLAGLQSHAQGSAQYHQGAGRYLFLAGVTSVTQGEGAIFEAPRPWGPWTRVGKIPGMSISSFLAKGAGARDLYFAFAGGTNTYNLNIGKIELNQSLHSD